MVRGEAGSAVPSSRRMGYYVKATDKKEAVRIMKQRYPGEPIEVD